MLDLELLERQLDEALSGETTESMTSWLLNRRLKKYVSGQIQRRFRYRVTLHDFFTSLKR